MSRSTRKGEDELHSTIKSVVIKLCNSEEFINSITASITETITQKFNKEIENLRRENKELVKKVQNQDILLQSLAEKEEKHEQHLRSRNIRFYGVKEDGNENCAAAIQEILSSKMNIDIESWHLDSCYRVGKYVRDKNRPIMVRFSTLFHKNIVYQNKKKLKSTGVIVKEDLTVEQMKVFKAAIAKVANNGRVWTNFGNIFAKFNGENDLIKLKCFDDVHNM
ncbi:unnamed protein product [Phaedon cochleariae]|uniref:Uncharacterized protein n=1 Tax=Phaedon cochleariae TaxID=80249 RepID=A0A9P0GPF0_PHACE|nr:unnamed protein product [Phaedon cochleariae]